jgi:8-oxo-dGTP pyrophosphatase MutT (NUDIX family)
MPAKRAKNFKYELSAGAVIFYQNGGREYLLLQYETKDKYWGFPKGMVERGIKESPEDAAFREIREETGLTKENLELVPGFREKIHYFYRDADTLISKDAVYFLIRSRSKTVTLSKEHLAFEWLPFDRARERLTHKNHRRVLEKAETFLNADPIPL